MALTEEDMMARDQIKATPDAARPSRTNEPGWVGFPRLVLVQAVWLAVSLAAVCALFAGSPASASSLALASASRFVLSAPTREESSPTSLPAGSRFGAGFGAGLGVSWAFRQLFATASAWRVALASLTRCVLSSPTSLALCVRSRSAELSSGIAGRE